MKLLLRVVGARMSSHTVRRPAPHNPDDDPASEGSDGSLAAHGCGQVMQCHASTISRLRQVNYCNRSYTTCNHQHGAAKEPWASCSHGHRPLPLPCVTWLCCRLCHQAVGEGLVGQGQHLQVQVGGACCTRRGVLHRPQHVAGRRDRGWQHSNRTPAGRTSVQHVTTKASVRLQCLMHTADTAGCS